MTAPVKVGRAPAEPAQWRVTLSDIVIGDAEVAAVTAVLRSRWLSAGPETRRFEEDFASALDAPDAVAVSSGTAALHLAVLALGLGGGDEVILPSLSFVSAAEVSALHHIKPVFADVRSGDDPTIDPADVERRITRRTRAIVAMHFAGYPADMAALRSLADAHGIALIEDAAHAPAVTTGLGSLGTIGDLGCFSFFATKNVAVGEGGMVVAHDPEHLAWVKRLRSHAMTTTSWDKHVGRPSGYDVAAIGLNYRPQEMAAALGRVQLSRLPADRRRRRALTATYHDRLLGAGVHVPFASAVARGDDSAFHLLPVLLPPGTSRDEVQQSMRQAGVQSSVHYPPTHLFSYYRNRFGTRPGDLPVTEDFAARELTLPLHTLMEEDDVSIVVEALDDALSGAGESHDGG